MPNTIFLSINNKGIEAIFNARKSLLYYNDEPWVKKGESNFDVTKGAYDGAEVCELIGIFMLPLLSKHKNYIGLYRDEKSRRKSFKIYLKKNI